MMHRWTVTGLCAVRSARRKRSRSSTSKKPHALLDGPVKDWLENFMDLWLKPPAAARAGAGQIEAPQLIAAE